MSRESHSEFAQGVLVKDEVLSYVLRVHLHVERWLHELLRRKLSKPDRFFNNKLISRWAIRRVK
jgi:hypothetical protein